MLKNNFLKEHIRNRYSNVTIKCYNNSWREVNNMIDGTDAKYFNRNF